MAQCMACRAEGGLHKAGCIALQGGPPVAAMPGQPQVKYVTPPTKQWKCPRCKNEPQTIPKEMANAGVESPAAMMIKKPGPEGELVFLCQECYGTWLLTHIPILKEIKVGAGDNGVHDPEAV